jgi:dihydroneopterin aldolase
MNKICIYQIEFDGHIGITAEERDTPQQISVDIELTCDISTESDNLYDTIDYDHLCKKIVAIGQTESLNLIETLAEKIVQQGLEDARVRTVLVRVKKCHPPLKDIKGGFVVEILRHRLC